MARWLYLLTIPQTKINEFRLELTGNGFEPIIGSRTDASPIRANLSEITLSIDVQGSAHKRIAEGFFQLHNVTQIGKPLRQFEEKKIRPTKFIRFLRKYVKKRKWTEAVALYVGTFFAVGGFELAKLIYDGFPESELISFNWKATFLNSLLPVIMHILYNYAHMPRESVVKLDES